MPGKRLEESKRECVRKLHEYFQKELANGGPLLPLNAIQDSRVHDVTVIKRNILSRKKRYLVFPKGSVMMVQLSAIKAVQQRQPTGWNFLEELEFPFFLPDDPNIFRRKNRIQRDRREIYSMVEKGLTKYGFDGKMCVKRMICDAKEVMKSQENSMIKDVIIKLFDYSDENFNYEEICTKYLEAECSIPIMQYFFDDILGIHF